MDAKVLMPIFRESIENACQDKPTRDSFKILGGEFVFTIKGNRDSWQELCQMMAVPSHATQTIEGERLISRWPSHADRVFGSSGLLAERLPGYEMRTAQLHAGRLFQRGIEMGEPVVAELPTGTGKSLTYLMIARAMGKRVIVSTSNKALQMQLYRKDAPFVNTIFPSIITLVQGKSNYICRNRLQDERVSDEQLKEWIDLTETGNTQEIDFEVDWKQLASLTVDDSCTGKACSFYLDCFYYQAKAERQAADILICNHMLLALHQKYPAASILPGNAVIVVDEAHQLVQYVTNALGVEFKLKTVEKQIELLRSYDAVKLSTHHEIDYGNEVAEIERDYAVIDLQHNALPSELEITFTTWQNEISVFARGKPDTEIAIPTEHVFTKGLAVADMISSGADAIWDASVKPSGQAHIRRANVAQRIRQVAEKIRSVSYQTQSGFVRWFNTKEQSIHNVPFDVADFIGHIAGFGQTEVIQPDHTRCARCNHILTADVVNLLGGIPYGPTCIDYVDPFGDAEQVDLQEWLKREHLSPTKSTHDKTGIIFTSATLLAPDPDPNREKTANPLSFTSFVRECGLPHSMTMLADSPFNYEENSLLYIPNGNSPNPKKNFEFDLFVIEQIREMVYASGGGAFLLFTSNKGLNNAVDALRKEFERRNYPVYVQGQGYSKLEIINRMKEDGNGILFATKSFFEGVDIQGNALRLVVIDKLPFAALSPFNTAKGEDLRAWARQNLRLNDKDLEFYPFNAKSIPDMVIDLKQGTGRLIRSTTDRGVIAILDNRLLTTEYGRKALAALPSSKRVSDMKRVKEFFAAKEPDLIELYDLAF